MSYCDDLRKLLADAKAAALSKIPTQIEAAQDALDDYTEQDKAPPKALRDIANGAYYTLGVAVFHNVLPTLVEWETARAKYCLTNNV